MPTARANLYRAFFTSFVAVASPNDLPGRKLRHRRRDLAVEEVRRAGRGLRRPGGAGGAAGLHGADEGSRKALEDKLDRMKELFTEPAQQQAARRGEGADPGPRGQGVGAPHVRRQDPLAARSLGGEQGGCLRQLLQGRRRRADEEPEGRRGRSRSGGRGNWRQRAHCRSVSAACADPVRVERPD